MNFERILHDMITNSAPILLCVLGGNFAFKANVVNIALEGMLLLGAFFSVLFVMFTESIAIGMFVSLGFSLIFGLIFSVMVITKKGNPIITGLAINLIAVSFCAFSLKAMGLPNINVNNIVDVAGLKTHIPIIEKIPFFGEIISGHSFLTYFSFITIFITWVIMFKTKFGIYVRVVGENTDASSSVGISENKIRYMAVLISSFCCALAGINLALENLALFTNGMSAGIGFIALAAINCGKGMPVKTSFYAVLFGLCQSLSVNLNISAGPASGLFKTLPYFMIIIILTMVSIVQLSNSTLRGFKNE